jgi:hypothetical protein
MGTAFANILADSAGRIKAQNKFKTYSFEMVLQRDLELIIFLICHLLLYKN